MTKLTFSFDNGPIPGATEPLLDFLAARGIKATFFLVGQQLETEAELALAARIKREGHWIGNHTLTHGKPLGLDGGMARVVKEIGETERRLEGLAEARKLFRPNGAGSLGPHLLSEAALAYLEREAYTVVTWNNVPGDWLEPHEQWYENALRDLAAEDWTLLVLHDKFIASMLDLLGRFCDELGRRGVEVVQDFPPSCVVLDKGRPTGPLEGLVTFGESRPAATA